MNSLVPAGSGDYRSCLDDCGASGALTALTASEAEVMAKPRIPISSSEALQLLRKWHKDNSVVLLETFKPSTRQRREFLVTIANMFEGSQSTSLEVRTIDLPLEAYAIDLAHSEFFMESETLRTVAFNSDETAFSLSTHV